MFAVSITIPNETEKDEIQDPTISEQNLDYGNSERTTEIDGKITGKDPQFQDTGILRAVRRTGRSIGVACLLSGHMFGRSDVWNFHTNRDPSKSRRIADLIWGSTALAISGSELDDIVLY